MTTRTLARWPKDEWSMKGLSRLDHALRTKACMDWMKHTDGKATEFPNYAGMTAREVNVAIGWDKWPDDWPLI